jgi:Protein of unknown function (DUF3455)
MPRPLLPTTALVCVAATLAACAASPMTLPAKKVDNAALPEAVRAPADAKFLLLTTGVGELTYECRVRTDDASQHAWAFVSPVATLYGEGRKVVGKYYAGPTWEHNDGSRVTGKQLAVSPAAPGSIALQLVKADAPSGSGVLQRVTHIQRLNTKGGVAPQMPCGAANAGARQVVKYEADYAFYGK